MFPDYHFYLVIFTNIDYISLGYEILSFILFFINVGMDCSLHCKKTCKTTDAVSAKQYWRRATFSLVHFIH